MRHEEHNMHGTGSREHEVYDMPAHDDYWPAVTGVPCPVPDCTQTIIWYEAGHVPGYRVCAQASPDGRYDTGTIRHHFQAKGNGAAPTLVRHDCCE